MMYTPIQVTPEYSKLQCPGIKMEVIRVKICGKEYQMCADSHKNFWSQTKTSDWGKSQFEEVGKAVRMGRLGEMAFGKVTNCPIDLSYKEHGDLQDTTYLGKTVNVKCQKSLYGVWVRCEDNGYPITLHEDVFVFSYLSSEGNGFAVVDLLGSLLKSQLIRFPIVQRTGHTWKNYVASYSDLYPMRNLLSLK